MTLAGTNEPHTVWRTWSEFTEFSNRLTEMFATTTAELPRLNRKFSLVVTKSVIATRQEELDLFLHRLFRMPEHIKNCELVKDFFRMRGQQEHLFTAAPSPEDFEGPEAFGHFLSNARPVNVGSATIGIAPPSSSKNLAPKSSTPDLRKLLVNEDGRVRPIIPPRSASSLAVQRSSSYSNASASSASSSATITPGSSPPTRSTPTSVTRLPSPLSQQHAIEESTPQAVQEADPEPIVDVMPTRPVAADVQRSSTSPELRQQLPPLQTDLDGAIFGRTHRPQSRRTGSRSSLSSFEDGSPVSVSDHQQTFHVGPSGRIGYGPDPRLRRPSMPSRSNSFQRSVGHMHTPSSSSTDSERSSFDFGRTLSTQSRGSSTDFSDAYPVTPPTPLNARVASSDSTKQPWLSNNLPPAPFFPLPPTSAPLQAAFSLDGAGHPLRPRHRRKSSSDSRSSRSMLSVRSPLEQIPGSPGYPSSGPYEHEPSQPASSTKLVLKVLHPASNFLVRIDRDASFEQAKEQIADKFRSCGIAMSQSTKAYDDSGVGLDDHAASTSDWKLEYVPSKAAIANGATSYVLESSVEYEHCLAVNTNADKITLRVEL